MYQNFLDSAECILFSAGTDTTSVLVSYALKRLSENLDKCEKLRKEVTEAAGDSMVADISTLAKLPYVGFLISVTCVAHILHSSTLFFTKH